MSICFNNWACPKAASCAIASIAMSSAKLLGHNLRFSTKEADTFKTSHLQLRPPFYQSSIWDAQGPPHAFSGSIARSLPDPRVLLTRSKVGATFSLISIEFNSWPPFFLQSLSSTSTLWEWNSISHHRLLHSNTEGVDQNEDTRELILGAKGCRNGATAQKTHQWQSELPWTASAKGQNMCWWQSAGRHLGSQRDWLKLIESNLIARTSRRFCHTP